MLREPDKIAGLVGTTMDIADNWVLKLLLEVGVDLQRLQQQHPGEYALLAQELVDTPMDAALTLLIAAAEQTGDADLGLHMGEQVNFKRMGVYGYVVCNAHTLGEFFELTARYFNILFSTAIFKFQRGDTVSSMEYRHVTPSALPPRHDIEWALGTFICFVRSLVGAHWHPVSVHLSYEAPVDTSELKRLFGEELYFSERASLFVIENGLLDLTINDSDPRLLEVMKAYADQLMSELAHNDSFYHRVRLLTMHGMAENGFGEQVLARRLGMSARTLKRRLAQLQLTFRRVREDIIETLARQSLLETELPVSTIALNLGYSEHAAFNHAFKRMTGMTPRDFRNKNRR
jgi:AraC-like DNA-binding protein